ncbi:MAG TPA: hypothetical protein VJB89_03070 [Candidatus Nanoarchaeia archaeon]|nr:hypothetical protein [Candidatus Nanoarchaeia archaeon]
MVKEKSIAIIGIIIAIISEWDKLTTFINSFFKGLDAFLSSIPPILLLVILILIILWLARKK